MNYSVLVHMIMNLAQQKYFPALILKIDYTVLLIQLDRNLASDISTRCSEIDQSIWSKRRKLSSYQVESREPCNLSSSTELN